MYTQKQILSANKMNLRFLIFSMTFFISFSLISVNAATHIGISVEGVTCNGEKNGKISIQIRHTTSDYKIAIKPLNKNSTKYITGSFDSTYTISELSAGKYHIKTSSDIEVFCDTIINLNEPKPFKINKIQVLKTPSSDNAADGIIVASAYGGIPPYSFQWDEKAGSQTNDTLTNLKYGIYKCRITDASECENNSKEVGILYLKEAFDK